MSLLQKSPIKETISAMWDVTHEGDEDVDDVREDGAAA